MRDEFLRELFAAALQTPEQQFKEGVGKQVENVQKLRRDLVQVEMAFAKLEENNDCESMLAAIEALESCRIGFAAITHNTAQLHTMHILTAPQHEKHRKDFFGSGPLH